MNIMRLCEIRWIGAGVITPDYCKSIYSGDDIRDRGAGVIPDM